jgi:integrase
MKPAHRLFKRGKFFYAEEINTGRQESLQTADRQEAQRLLLARNEASNNFKLTLAVGRAYLAATDPGILTRTWSDVMEVMCKRGAPSTQKRCRRGMQSRAFDLIRGKVIAETTAADFLTVLADGRLATNHYLKLLHSLAMDLDWIVGRPILGRKCWPRVNPRPKRGITWEEHCKIVSTECSTERKLFYEMLWETGASQTDASRLSSENVDWESRTLTYIREKTGEQSCLRIGSRLEGILRQLPVSGPFFPHLVDWDSVRRAAEFNRRCRILKITGVSLHSYRYAWAERAFSAGYPERYAQAALGHGSQAIHHAYARRAKVNCPALEEYESKIVPLPNVQASDVATQRPNGAR